MPRSARRYDIYLPLTYNDGTLIPKEKYEAVEDRLLQHFGGLTAQQREFPFRGMWQQGPEVFYDQVIVLTALDFRRQGSARFLAGLKAVLLREFDHVESTELQRRANQLSGSLD